MTDSRTKKFIYNSLITAIYQVVLIAANFVTPHFIIKFYGSEANGLVSSITQFITYFSIVEAGLAGASMFALYKPLAEHDHGKINSIVSATKVFYYKSGYVFVGLVVALSAIYPFTVAVSAFDKLTVALLVLLMGAKGFMDFFALAKYRALLSADQKTYVVSFASGVYIILNTIIIVVLSAVHAPILLVYLLAISALIVRTVILAVYCKVNYPYINYSAKPDNKALNKRWDAMVWQIVQALQTGAPTIIATFTADIIRVSIFSVYNMVVMGMSSILSVFRSGVAASFGEVIAKKQHDVLKKSYNEFEYAYLQMIAVLYSVTAVMLVSFVHLYTNKITDGVNYYSMSVAIISCINGVLYNMKTPPSTLIVAAGHYRETRWRAITQGGLLLVLSTAFGIIAPAGWKIQAILLGSCISNLYRDIDLLIYAPKHVTKSSVIYPLKNYVLMFLTILFSVGLGYLLVKNIALFDWSWFSWLIYAAGCTVISCGVAFVISCIFNRDILKSLFLRLKNMIKK